MNQLKKCSLVLGIVSTLATVPLLQAQQALPFYEPFPSSYGFTRLGDTTSVGTWTQGGGLGGGSPNFTNQPMSYLNLVTDASSYSMYMPGIASGTRNRGFEFTSTTSGTLYASFLLDVVTAPTNANRMIAFLTSASTQSASAGVVGVFVNPNSQLQISKNASATTAVAPGTTAAVNSTENLVVVRYTWNAGTGDDEFSLWLNPTSLGGADPGGADISTSTGTDFANLSWFYINQRNNSAVAGSDLYFDELRIGDTWASVTPVVPEPSSIALLGMAALAVVTGYRRIRQ